LSELEIIRGTGETFKKDLNML